MKRRVELITEACHRVCQGGLYGSVEYVNGLRRREEDLWELEKLVFPLVIVLTQDCDLNQDYASRVMGRADQDKNLVSVLVVPVYNREHFMNGEHLELLGRKMQVFGKKDGRRDLLEQNQLPRYHFLNFDPKTWLPPSIVDFKHYFSVDAESLETRGQFVGRLRELFREDLSQRFSSFLARVGLPDQVTDDPKDVDIKEDFRTE